MEASIMKSRAQTNQTRRPISSVTRSIFFLLGTFLVMFTLLSYFAPNFTSFGNLINILRHMSTIAIVGVGMTMVIISAEIDLSVGSIAAFCGVCLAYFVVKMGIPVPISFAMTLCLGALFGSFTGALRVFLNIPSFITSLALLTALSSGAFLISGGFPISPMPAGFSIVGNGKVGPIPVPVVIMIVTYAVGYFVMAKTSWGRAIYAVGGNEEAARLSGINVAGTKIGVFAIVGMLAALAGIILASRLNSGTPTVARGMELEVIAAVIIGGTSLFGGLGSVVGTLLGALFMATLKNGMVLMGVSPFSQGVVSGTVIILAVLAGALQARRS
jgi:ribose/xylose/arabinose/galactoside ABC-type transport system permease subunit